jgi:hypothetical protein
MKICAVEAELFHVDECSDGQSDITKLIVAFHNFTNAPKIVSAFNAENIFHGCDQVELSPMLFLIKVGYVFCTDI